MACQGTRAQISEEHKFYFVHVPKCGGTSFDELAQFKEEYALPRGGHRSLAYFISTLGTRLSEFHGCSVVRNPWDRIVSAFAYLQNGGSGSKAERYIAKNLLAQHKSVRSFLHACENNPSLIDKIGHMHPMVSFCDMALLKDTPKGHFMVVKLEDLVDDSVREALRVHLRLDTLDIPHVRKGPARSDRELPPRLCLREREFDFVRDYYAKDIEMFGYGGLTLQDLHYS